MATNRPPRVLLSHPNIRDYHHASPLVTINQSMNVQDAIHYYRLTINAKFPPVKVVRILLDINWPQTKT